MTTDVKILEVAGFSVKKHQCGYTIVKTEKGTTFLILDKLYGFELIPPEGEECKYFRTLSDIVEHIKNR